MFLNSYSFNLYLNQQKELFGNDIYIDNYNHKLNVLYNSIKNCSNCILSETRNKLVFGYGNPNSEIVFIGEAPGKNEDLKGYPFVGKSGQLLDKILSAISLSREEVYIANIVKCRPPNNRDPKIEEIKECRKHLDLQLQLIKPNVIIALGKIAGNTLLNNDLPLNEMRCKSFAYNKIDVIVTYHPAALLRNPNFKKPCWDDFKNIKSKYIN